MVKVLKLSNMIGHLIWIDDKIGIGYVLNNTPPPKKWLNQNENKMLKNCKYLASRRLSRQAGLGLTITLLVIWRPKWPHITHVIDSAKEPHFVARYDRVSVIGNLPTFICQLGWPKKSQPTLISRFYLFTRTVRPGRHRSGDLPCTQWSKTFLQQTPRLMCNFLDQKKNNVEWNRTVWVHLWHYK